jgi:hypothetical protein
LSWGGDCHESSPFSHGIDDEEIQLATNAGKSWRLEPKIPDFVLEHWALILDAASERLFFTPKYGAPLPNWCKSAQLLLIAADEACYGVERFTGISEELAGGTISWVDEYLKMLDGLLPESKSDLGDGLIVERRELSIAISFNQDVACVQPKCKTAYVGCTLRTMSQHLALLPHRGEIRTQWLRPATENLGHPSAGMNILLIPYPYKIDDSCFSSHNGKPSAGMDRDWGWFDVTQKWLPDTPKEEEDFLKFIRKLLVKAEEIDGPVQAVVFPELSLNWHLFQMLANMFRREFKSVELFISGSSTNCRGDQGNFVLNANFFDFFDEDGSRPLRKAMITSRPKHHRWKLDKYQIANYGLEQRLHGKSSWWERIPIPPRELHVHLFREGCAFTTLICEDLARNDPCHESLRSLGPNLVFVLLMDGPQLPERWAARYSTGLSDDPGSSVLTFTSRALLDASHRAEVRKVKEAEKAGHKYDPLPKSWNVALWKDDESAAFPIKCSESKQATLLRIFATELDEVTIDGRCLHNCWSWRKQGRKIHEIGLRGDPEFNSIVKQFTRARR